MSIEQSLRKLSRGRIDAFIWAQEEADLMLRQLKLTNVHREHLGISRMSSSSPRGLPGMKRIVSSARRSTGSPPPASWQRSTQGCTAPMSSGNPTRSHYPPKT